MQNTSSPGTTIFVQALLLTTLLAGSLDALSAIIQFTASGNREPARIFRYIASALFGKPALSGGTPMVVYGVILHYCIAFLWTLLFFLLYPHVPILSRQPVLSGIAYGIFVWIIMNYAVVPLSLIGRFPSRLQPALIGAGIIIIAIGLPISLLAKRWLRPNASPAP
ncbi:MAG: hypothetical protein JST68_06405 [Bacteroidetes bacterium]|nr:hypothetical protein [Bacteroidota bacterium]